MRTIIEYEKVSQIRTKQCRPSKDQVKLLQILNCNNKVPCNEDWGLFLCTPNCGMTLLVSVLLGFIYFSQDMPCNKKGYGMSRVSNSWDVANNLHFVVLSRNLHSTVSLRSLESSAYQTIKMATSERRLV